MTREPLWEFDDVVRVVRGTSPQSQNWTAQGVAIDSMACRPGDIFVALQGPNHDAHDFVDAAFKAGAIAAIVSKRPTTLPADANLVFVEDTLDALERLARAARTRTTAKIIAVTGSVGKTSTKEMLRTALSSVGMTYANHGNFNNHWGVPLSLANLPSNAEYGIFELGMNHPGEIEALSRLVRPDVAVITNVEAVHLEFFPSTAAIADAKAEIFSGMTEHGIAVLNRSNKYFSRLSRAAAAKGIKKVFSFASKGRGSMRLIDSALTTEGSAVNAMLLDYNIHYSIGAPGLHLVQNSLAVLLTAAVVSGEKDKCARALARYKQPEGRGVTTAITLAQGGQFTLIDESYNANPPSVLAAISVLGRVVPHSGGRRILVLGDMRELGSTSARLHSDLAKPIVDARIDSVFCCGDMMQYMFGALPASLQGGYAADSVSLARLVANNVGANDTVSVKGSKSMHLDAVVNALKAREAPIHQEASI